MAVGFHRKNQPLIIVIPASLYTNLEMQRRQASRPRFVPSGQGFLAEGRMRAKMYEIVKSDKLTPDVIKLEIKAPHIARKAKAGQFIMVTPTEHGERVPLTMPDFSPEKGTITSAVR